MVEKDLIFVTNAFSTLVGHPGQSKFCQIGDNFGAETLGKGWKAVYGRRRPPVPAPFMHFARGMTGRDGTSLTGPVLPVKTVTASIPTSLFLNGGQPKKLSELKRIFVPEDPRRLIIDLRVPNREDKHILRNN
ncbi:hypothetical protein B0H16DRAFT_1461398 [Mycena metata]|uniref:Uncharacterized protein n=1 Tax=Mycena metata TaxID=1033252 RepID=A0AAD7IRA9_9AGAR|nr:hypothetical protein B0H16DRAFT_1461398 [Mycena metata]